MSNKLGKNFKKMMPLYILFAGDSKNLDLSGQAALDAYNLETHGKVVGHTMFDTTYNGFIVGKKFLNLTVTMWKDGIQEGYLFIEELYEDEMFADYHWWLDSIFKKEKDERPTERNGNTQDEAKDSTPKYI